MKMLKEKIRISHLSQGFSYKLGEKLNPVVKLLMNGVMVLSRTPQETRREMRQSIDWARKDLRRESEREFKEFCSSLSN